MPRRRIGRVNDLMTKRIAIVGSFSTGKTTLAEAAAPELGLPLLPEVAREVVELGFKLDKDATVETETLIFLRQYYNEMTHSDFIGDRSLVDVMAYASWVLEHQERRKEFALWDTCLDIAKHHLRSQYTDVFYLPIEFDIVPDGLRPMDPEFQQDIDRRLLGLLEMYDIVYSTLKGSVEDRVAAILDAVGG